MIKRLQVEKLNEVVSCDLIFNPDLNILVGKNGSGKTTLLKLIWYLISGNIEKIFREMSFELLRIETDDISLFIRRNSRDEVPDYTFEAFIDGVITTRTTSLKIESPTDYVELLNRRIAPITGSSLFFPTFRRVEGGFSVQNDRKRGFVGENSLEESMRRFSMNMSVLQHSFVSSISTQDIIRLITEKYADVSETTNALHSRLSANIISRINVYTDARDISPSTSSPDSVLKEIEHQVAEVSRERNELLKPFSLLSEITNRVFNKSIRITDSIVLGNADDAILSDKLSAGEKQMLSFLCYNAFYKNTPIFIDEPELSLHADWQRILFPSLLKQNTGNQFIIATHSPFIYAKYPDKELVLNPDRGE
jgi:predicted ATP-binding protein involved in virulence